MNQRLLWTGLLVFLGAASILAQSSVLSGHTRDIHAVACSPDGKSLVSGGEDSMVFVWEVASRQHTGQFKGDASLSVAISPDGKRIASGERYNKVRLLDSSAKEVKTLEGHAMGVIAVAFSPDGKVLMSFAKDGGIRLWDAGTGAPQAAVQKVPDSFDSAAFSADGKWAVGGATGFTYLHNLSLKKLAWKVDQPANAKAVAISPDSRLVAVALGNDTVRLLDATTGKEKGKADVDANGLAFSPDGTKLAAAGHDNDVHLIDIATMKASPLKGHDRTVRAVCFMPDGRTVASASFDMTVRFWVVP